MLIREKLPSGHIYPQITQAPINYFDFLNFFRGGQTIDDNLAAGAIASTLQANLLRAAISSGHLTKTKNMAITDEFLADIVLTDEGARQILTPQDKQIPTPQDKQPMESHKSDWERVSEAKLGGGGQSDVYLVRTPERTKKRIASLAAINRFTPVQMVTAEQITKANIEYVEAIREYTRPDLPSELGAMKEFKLRDNAAQSQQRLEQEIEVLQQNRPGLPKLLGSNASERWMVTEYFPSGTLEDHILEYKGHPALALKAFQSVVSTVALLHKDGIVHRDIKPANIFVRNDHELILGDFGLVFMPERQRLTFEGETVGARDFIPLWGEEDSRLVDVKTDFDVYMLGKVLWCMVAGRSVLRRELFLRANNDVTKLFPSDPHTHMINVILKHSVVEEQKDCWSSASDLLLVVDTNVEQIKQGGQLLLDGITRICHVCGVGRYARQALVKDIPSYNMRLWDSGARDPSSTLGIEVWECGTCHHIQFFRANPRP